MQLIILLRCHNDTYEKDAHKLFPKKMSKSLWCLKKSLIFATALSEMPLE